MKPVNNHKYLVSSEKDQTWGITVDTVGSESVAAGYETYPPRVGHPSGFYFDVGKGECGVDQQPECLFVPDGEKQIRRFPPSPDHAGEKGGFHQGFDAQGI